MTYFRWKALSKTSKVYKKGTFGPLQALLLYLGGAELHESATSLSKTKCSDMGAQKGHRTVSTISFNFSILQF